MPAVLGVLTNELARGFFAHMNPAAALSTPVSLQGLAISTFQVVLVPTVLGALTNELARGSKPCGSPKRSCAPCRAWPSARSRWCWCPRCWAC